MKRIVIIDDDEATRNTLDAVLTEEGYEALPIMGPGDLLAQIAEVGPDLVLLDLLLGNWGDGLVLGHAIRAHPLLAQVPILVLSAAPARLRHHADVLTTLRCLMLEKPFELDELLAVISGALAAAQG